jgi:CspA family cold shock protein
LQSNKKHYHSILAITHIILLIKMFAVSRVFAGAFKVSTRAALDVRRFKTSGRVKFFDPTKGFGFILSEDGSEDIFVHQTSIIPADPQGFRSLHDGEEVEYDLKTNDNGKPTATNVTGPNGAGIVPRLDPARPLGAVRFDDE